MEATVDAVRRDQLRPGGGVYRYRGDTYYGGGEWILLACSLGWYEVMRGNADAALSIREWARAQARTNGDLPEQVSEHVQSPEMVAPWVERWGPAASPLLWSHAMYLILEAALAT
jgi:GH15 family glucan-1,4-alpha-glucosidase